MFVKQQVSLQHQSAGGELLVGLCSIYHWDVVVAIVLCDETHGRPVALMVVWVEGDELLRVRLVQSVNLNGVLEGVAQQEHLNLKKTANKQRQKQLEKSRLIKNV